MMQHRSPRSAGGSTPPEVDPHNDLADAPADSSRGVPSGTPTPRSVQDERDSRPIDRIDPPEGDRARTRGARSSPKPVAPTPTRQESGSIRWALALAGVLVLAGVAIGAFVMERPIPTLGLAAIACGMLLLFAAPILTASAVDARPPESSDRPDHPAPHEPATRPR